MREQWSGRIGFVLAASGSAVGLGSIWKFPYLTGMHGGGIFIAVYAGCVLLVAVPILIAEILLGRHSRRATVATVRHLGGGRRSWLVVGWVGVLGSGLILSYYSVVGGWTLHYLSLAVGGAAGPVDADAARHAYRQMIGSPFTGVVWQTVFLVITIWVVAGGVQQGLERASRWLMPILFVVMLGLLVRGFGLPGFESAWRFAFVPRIEDLSPRSLLEALGHSFFSLSVGLGAMLTYGSYLSRTEDVPLSAITIACIDTLVSLLACLIVFPILFTSGLDPDAGPGLIFLTLPVAFAGMAFGALWSALFFALLAIAALASAFSMLEVVVSHLIEERGWSRRRAAVTAGLVISLIGLPSAWSGSFDLFGPALASQLAAIGLPAFDWFGLVDFVSSNLLLPIGSLGLAALAAWRFGSEARADEYCAGSSVGGTYRIWLIALRYLALPAVVLIMARALASA